MAEYKVFRTMTADSQITEIIRYVAADSGNEVALSCLDRMKEAIGQLATVPFFGSVPRYAALRRRGYRFLTSDRWLIFFKVFEQDKTVMVYAVLDASRDYLNLH